MKPALETHTRKNILFKEQLVDPFGRKLDYLRLSLTERCNLRCTYCMPAQGVPLTSRDNILSFEEMDRLVQIFLNLGVQKIRITGGEPFVRKGAFEFIRSINQYEQLQSLNITTNAVFIDPYLTALKKLKMESLNISLDSLNRDTFKKITLKDNFDVVYQNIIKAINLGIPVKINVVVLAGINDGELTDFVRLAREYALQIRFIEAMPFNGGKFDNNQLKAQEIIAILKNGFVLQEQPRGKNATARVFKIPDYRGSIGVIEGFSRTFCGSCNRLRITADGMFKTCLYDRVALNFKQLIRAGKSDDEILKAVKQAVSDRAVDGFEAQARTDNLNNLSMAQIGG